MRIVSAAAAILALSGSAYAEDLPTLPRLDCPKEAEQAGCDADGTCCVWWHIPLRAGKYRGLIRERTPKEAADKLEMMRGTEERMCEALKRKAPCSDFGRALFAARGPECPREWHVLNRTPFHPHDVEADIVKEVGTGSYDAYRESREKIVEAMTGAVGRAGFGGRLRGFLDDLDRVGSRVAELEEKLCLFTTGAFLRLGKDQRDLFREIEADVERIRKGRGEIGERIAELPVPVIPGVKLPGVRPPYAEIRAPRRGRIAFRTHDGRWGFAREDGRPLVAPKFDEATDFGDDDKAIVRIGDAFYEMDLEGKLTKTKRRPLPEFAPSKLPADGWWSRGDASCPHPAILFNAPPSHLGSAGNKCWASSCSDAPARWNASGPRSVIGITSKRRPYGLRSGPFNLYCQTVFRGQWPPEPLRMPRSQGFPARWHAYEIGREPRPGEDDAWLGPYQTWDEDEREICRGWADLEPGDSGSVSIAREQRCLYPNGRVQSERWVKGGGWGLYYRPDGSVEKVEPLDRLGRPHGDVRHLSPDGRTTKIEVYDAGRKVSERGP